MINQFSKKIARNKGFTRHFYNKSGGFATLEMLIALVVITLAITGVIMVSFGNQSITLDSDLNNRALYRAEGLVEGAHAQAKNDFLALASYTLLQETEAPYYNQKLEVIDGECSKRVIGTVTWWENTARQQEISLSNIFTDLDASEAFGNDCDPIITSSSWENPTPYNFGDPVQGGSQGTDLDVVKILGKKIVILTTEKHGNEDTLWVIDATNHELPVLFDSESTEESLNAVDAYTTKSGLIYAFVASASVTNQLRIFKIDIENETDPTTEVLALQLPGVDPDSPTAAGISVFYYSGYVFVGTERTDGPEFHIFSFDESNPTATAPIGSLELNHHVNDIFVKGQNAYIASSAEFCELIVIDISNPGSMINPCPAPPIPSNNTVFDAEDVGPDNPNGTSIYVIGEKAYLGRKQAGSIHNFYILDIKDLNNIQSMGSLDLDLKSNGPQAAEVVGLSVRGPLAFVLTSDETPSNGGGPFMVFDISDLPNITKISTCDLNYSEKASGLDFMDDLIYVSNKSQNAFRIIYPSPVCNP